MKVYMASDVRTVLGDKPAACRNISLLASKFPGLADNEGDKQSRTEFLSQACRLPADGKGRAARIEFLEQTLPKARPSVTFRARLQSRLIVNQARGVIENAGLCLDPHFGVPFIPGSALKGVARAAALIEVKEGQASLAEVLAVFGWAPAGKEDLALLEGARAARDARENAFAGTVSFLPSYPATEARLVLDIVTCHYRAYYQGTDPNRTCSDTEAPVPNAFPAVESGCEFAFAVASCGAARLQTARKWFDLPATFDPLAAAERWLRLAISDHGVGAKTAAGYGWFAAQEDSR